MASELSDRDPRRAAMARSVDAAEATVASGARLPRVQPRHSATPDPAEILTRRLTQLGERDWMCGVLQRALDQVRPATFVVEQYEIDHCKVTPWRDISVALSLTLRSTRTGELSRQIVSGAVLASVDDARRLSQEEHLPAPGAGLLRPSERTHALMALVPEMAMVVRLFPYDSGLPGLSYAADQAKMTELLASCLPECRDEGWRIRDLEYEPLQYKPRRLCTLRYTLTLDHPQHLDTRRVVVFGKVYRDDRWRRSHALLEATWQASLASGGSWYAARPLAAVDAWAFIVQSAVGGRQFRHVLGDLTNDSAGPDDLEQAEGHVTAVARAVHGLHQAPIRLGPRLDFGALLGAQQSNLEYLSGVHPALARELHRLRTNIERCASASAAAALVFSHGDFAHGNVMLDDGRPGIIDFDRAGQAEPAYDVAYFLTHLASFSLRHPERAAQVRRLSDHLRESYCELAPAAVSAHRLAVYEALDLSAYVLRNFRKRSHQPEWIGWAKGQIDSAWERLDCASAERRTASS